MMMVLQKPNIRLEKLSPKFIGEGAPMKTSILDATKIQARIVIPIVKALERELGKQAAHELVGRAIAENYVAWREKIGFDENSRSWVRTAAR